MKHLRNLDIRRIVTGILLLIGLFTVFSCRKTPELAKLPSDGVLLAFGDSLTFGTGVAAAESYPSVLEKRIGIAAAYYLVASGIDNTQ